MRIDSALVSRRPAAAAQLERRGAASHLDLFEPAADFQQALGGMAVNVVERFAEAFNRRDVDGLLGCFTEDATYRDLFYGPHAGQAALRGMFERMFREGRDYRWQMGAIVMDAHRAAAEWTFSYTATAAVPRSEGRRVRFSGMSVFDLDGGDLDGGRVRAYREYADTGVALLQLGFAPESVARVLSRCLPTA